jgi:hypothetical protein
MRNRSAAAQKILYFVSNIVNDLGRTTQCLPLNCLSKEQIQIQLKNIFSPIRRKSRTKSLKCNKSAKEDIKMPEQKNKKANSTPTYRVFISSTSADMQKYREAISNAILRADCMPVGMEWFGAKTTPPLDTCYQEMETCHIYLCALGMRYGDIVPETQKSFVQLEYEKAEALGMPMLVFLVDEEKALFRASDIESGLGAEKLKLFKDRIKTTKSVTYASFASPDELEKVVLQSIQSTKNDLDHLNDKSKKTDSYIEGAKKFHRFVTRPAIYQNREAILRVRFDGLYGGWRLRDEIAIAFGFVPGTFLFLNDIFTLGIKPSVDLKNWVVDCFAIDSAADWLEENEIESGTIFEAKFRFAYKTVENGAGIRGLDRAIDAKIANLIMIEGISVISRDVNTHKKNDDREGCESYYDYEPSTKGR